MREGAFSNRDNVGCEHKGSPSSGDRPAAILKMGSQPVEVVGVLIAGRNRKHPKPEHLLDRVLDEIRIALVLQAR